MTSKDKNQRTEKADFREHYQQAINKSEDDFEKNIIYLSSGALGLTLIFIEKIVPPYNSVYLFFLIFGWSLLTITLAVNLASHLISKKFIQKSQIDFDDYINDSIDYEELDKNITSRNIKIDWINWISLALFILGILSIVLFTSLNFINMAKQKDSSTEKKISKSVKVELGRVIALPQKPIVNNSSTKSTKNK
ncbi:MAG: hypothetical protein RL308_2387 [Bacteroidota bacterium]|jgi:anaerobic C4-dicarboxylate transporter